MPKAPGALGALTSLWAAAEDGRLDGLFEPMDALLTALSMYRPAQGFETELDKESFVLQHQVLRGSLTATIKQLLELKLLPPPPTDDPASLPMDDVIDGLEAWLADVDAAIARVTPGHVTAAPPTSDLELSMGAGEDGAR
jgi:hypothetical protein